MKWFANLSLFRKILLVSIVMLMSAITWGSFNAYMAYFVMKADTEERNKFLVESVYTMITGLNQEVLSGHISKDDAQKYAIEALRKSRYEGNSQYFWINNTDGQAVMHPIFPEMESQDISKTKRMSMTCLKLLPKPSKPNRKAQTITMIGPNPGRTKIFFIQNHPISC